MSAVIFDAYTRPRVVVPGCQHQMGCRCEPPYWLRASSPKEIERTRKLRAVFEARLDEEKEQAPEV